MLVGEAAPSGPVGGKVLASRASQFFASAEARSSRFLIPIRVAAVSWYLMSAKLTCALGAYALLALVAAIALTEPRLKAGVFVLMAALAAKTSIGEIKRRSEQNEQQPTPPE